MITLPVMKQAQCVFSQSQSWPFMSCNWLLDDTSHKYPYLPRFMSYSWLLDRIIHPINIHKWSYFSAYNWYDEGAITAARWPGWSCLGDGANGIGLPTLKIRSKIVALTGQQLNIPNICKTQTCLENIHVTSWFTALDSFFSQDYTILLQKSMGVFALFSHF
jgi:hypothetical protein